MAGLGKVLCGGAPGGSPWAAIALITYGVYNMSTAEMDRHVRRFLRANMALWPDERRHWRTVIALMSLSGNPLFTDPIRDIVGGWMTLSATSARGLRESR